MPILLFEVFTFFQGFSSLFLKSISFFNVSYYITVKISANLYPFSLPVWQRISLVFSEYLNLHKLNISIYGKPWRQSTKCMNGGGSILHFITAHIRNYWVSILPENSVLVDSNQWDQWYTFKIFWLTFHLQYLRGSFNCHKSNRFMTSIQLENFML